MNYFSFDWEWDFLNYLQTIHNGPLNAINVFLSKFGNNGYCWIALAIILVFPKKTRKLGLQMGCAMALTFLVGNIILKNAVNRCRPCWYDNVLFENLWDAPNDKSFPSGHTMNGFTAALTIAYNNWKWGIPALILAACIAFSRMYLYHHFPTDVIGGILVGIFSSVTMHLIFKFWQKKLQEKQQAAS